MFAGVADVTAEVEPCLRWVPGNDGIEDGQVFVVGFGEEVLVLADPGLQDGEEAGQPAQGRFQPGIGAGFRPPGVQFAIELEAECGPVAMGTREGSTGQALEGLRLLLKKGIPGQVEGKEFEVFAQNIEGSDIVAAQGADEGGVVGTEDDQAGFRGAPDGLAERGAADAPIAGQSGFAEGLTGGEASGEDGFHEPMVDAVGGVPRAFGSRAEGCRLGAGHGRGLAGGRG